MRLAPEGSAGKYCSKCDRYLTIKQWRKVDEADSLRCPHCRARLLGNELSSDFRAEDLRFLKDDEVRSNHWFHISAHVNWDGDTKAKGLFVHLGSKEAALERLWQLRAQNTHWETAEQTPQFYLHEVKLGEKTKIAPGVYNDQVHLWPESSRDRSTRVKVSLTGQGALRYMNEYEGPGTVSLLAKPNSYQLVASVAIPFSG